MTHISEYLSGYENANAFLSGRKYKSLHCNSFLVYSLKMVINNLILTTVHRTKMCERPLTEDLHSGDRSPVTVQ